MCNACVTEKSVYGMTRFCVCVYVCVCVCMCMCMCVCVEGSSISLINSKQPRACQV